jgi:2-succinyl-6-hydroxy-2,4-cyclohexadiene-1-carboxylate synthase
MRVVLIPGFTQTSSSWDAVRAALPERFEIRATDVPIGHDFDATAAALGDAGGHAVYVGYSMGGRLALRLAVDRPELVEGLVLVSASPGLADSREREARRSADDALAAEIENIGVDAFLDRWLAQPLFAGVPADAPGLAERRAFSAPDLATVLRRLGTGVQESLWNRLEQLRMPVLLVTGTGDAKFERIAVAMNERIATASHVWIEGGHALPLEAPADLAVAITHFVDDVAGADDHDGGTSP